MNNGKVKMNGIKRQIFDLFVWIDNRLAFSVIIIK